MKKLKTTTTELKNHLLILLEQFKKQEPPASMDDRQFFSKMKRETAPIYNILEEWETLALKEVQERTITIHPHQVISTKENIELIILHSYYIDARERQYMELNQSSLYILDQIINEINTKGVNNSE